MKGLEAFSDPHIEEFFESAFVVFKAYFPESQYASNLLIIIMQLLLELMEVKLLVAAVRFEKLVEDYFGSE